MSIPEPQDPGAALLPNEDWTKRTWAHMRHQLVLHLQRNGARSVQQLEMDRLHALFFPLDHDEIVAVVESARCRQLVEPLGHRYRVDDTALPDEEWSLTTHGRNEARLPLSWAGSQLMGVFGRLAPILFGVVSALGLSASLAHFVQGITLIGAFGIVFAAILAIEVLVLGLMVVRNRRTGGFFGVDVAADWCRFQREQPKWAAALMWRVPRPWLIVGAIATVVGFGLLQSGDHIVNRSHHVFGHVDILEVFAIPLSLFGMGVLLVVIGKWAENRSAIAEQATAA